MQENNFESIISSWRRMSGEQVESSAIESMSGDTPHNQSIKKKDEESMLLAIERPKGPIATAASAGTVVATVESTQDNAEPTSPEEKQDAIKHEKQGKEEAAGDAKFSKDNTDDKSYLENECLTNKSQENKWEKDRGDNVDSVYLRPPPQHKVRPSSPNNDDEDCGIKCLYYTLQCCDCVLQ